MTRQVKAQIQALVDVALGDRPDRHLLEPALVATLTTEVRDFVRYHPVELAAHRLREHAQVLADPRFRKAGR